MCSIVEGVQYRGGYHDACGDILSTVGDLMINVGHILSTVGVFSTIGGYHESVGDIMMHVGISSVPWGIPSFVI